MVTWNDFYLTGIEMIDDQHKHLVELTNQLFQACLLGGNTLDLVFRDTMSRLVEYVRMHFSTEVAMLQRINYPELAAHKFEHDSFIQRVLQATRNYRDEKFVPNKFVRFLRDWVHSHIAHSDRLYASFIEEQMKKNAINPADVTG